MNQTIWQGRWDGDGTEYHRLFQRVKECDDYELIQPKDFVIHGFAVEEGVRRNKGRLGAKNAPTVIRKNMSNFPVIYPDFRIFDFKDINCENGDLEQSQNELAEKVSLVISKEAKSIVLGGGHEVTFAHFSGIRKAFPEKKIGIINFDAHFDNREVDPNIGPSSGTGFWQIAQQEKINSLHIGIQKNSNTLKLFNSAQELGMKYILAEDLYSENISSIKKQIDALLDEVDLLYTTICMDVFNASIAPGVSAQAYNGLFANNTFMRIYKHILKSEKLVALDVAEVNPEFDIQERTARLAASLVNEWLMI